MYEKIFGKPLDALTEADIQALVERGVTEGPHLDYKRELGTKGEYRDLAKDVAAFANAYGGYLVYGVEEKKEGDEGEAEIEIVGLAIPDIDGFLSALEQTVRARTTPSVEVRTKAIELSTKEEDEKEPRYVVVVEVPPSLNAPHMADHVFYRRGDRTSSPMDYMEIRRAFSQRGDLVRGMRERLQRRIEDLEKGYGPVRWEPWAGAFLYVASVPTYDAAAVRVLGPEELRSMQRLRAFATGYPLGHHADGLLAAQERERYVDFALMTHEGELFHGVGPLREYVYCKQYGEEPPCIDAHAIELDVTNMLRSNLPRLRGVGFEGPYYLALVLARAGGYRIGWSRHRGRELQRPFLLFDQLLLDDDVRAIVEAPSDPYDTEAWQRGTRVVAARLQPVLDRLWQAGGFERSQLAHALDSAS